MFAESARCRRKGTMVQSTSGSVHLRTGWQTSVQATHVAELMSRRNRASTDMEVPCHDP